MKTPTSKDDARLLRLRSKAAYRARSSTTTPSVKASAPESPHGAPTTPKRRAPKNRRRARPTTIGPSSRSTARDRIIPATTFSRTACDTRTRHLSVGRGVGRWRPPPFLVDGSETQRPRQAASRRGRNLGLAARPSGAIRTSRLRHVFVRLRHHANPQDTFPTRRHGRSKSARPIRTETATKAHRPFARAVEGLRDQLRQREILRRVAAR